jgi:hypothetical protein
MIFNLSKNLAMLRCSCVFILLVFGFNTKAEVTYGYCSVKESKNGKDLYQLYGNTWFDCKPIDANFQQILLRVWVKKANVYDDQQILAKSKLYNEFGIIIGVALQDFTPYKFIAELDTAYVFDLSGIISQACINPSSVPETELNKILAVAKQNAQQDTFVTHLQKFKYEAQDTGQKYQSYIIYEPNFVLQKKEPRILIVFYKNELIAIFYSRNVIAKLYDSIEMGKEFKLIYNSKFTESTKSEMIQIFKKRLSDT